MNINAKNLNLLPILVAIGDEGSLTRAAEKLRLSQPALSHALQRLRDEFRDPLFVRESHGVVPTPACEAILAACRPLLGAVANLYSLANLEDFRTLRRELTLAATTYFELRIVEELHVRLRDVAPMVTLATQNLHGGVPARELGNGELDIAIAAYFEALPPSLRKKTVGTDPIVCVTRKAHPYLRARNRLDSYLSYQHIVISVPLRAEQAVDMELGKLGKRRDIAAHLNNFLTPPLLLREGDAIITLPESLARRYSDWFDLAIAKAPLPIPDLEITMVWHERFQEDPFHRWLRGSLEQIIGNPRESDRRVDP